MPKANIPDIQAFFDEATFTVSYLVSDPATKRGAVIDPVLDYDPASGEVDIASVEAILAAARNSGIASAKACASSVHPCVKALG